jgi:hypothetical protein
MRVIFLAFAADYKTDGGITWPRRFGTSIAGRRFEEVRSVFEPRK